MGKKSREKKERRAKIELDTFEKRVTKIKELFSMYDFKSVALALSASNLWLANSSSPVQHALAFRILLSDVKQKDKHVIASYFDFKYFLTELYRLLPSFPMLEDYSIQSDWGEVKACLNDEYVPMFYGDCIERSVDFIEAFRITYADEEQALTDMDLAIRIQSFVIQSMPQFLHKKVYSSPGAKEIPSKLFWETLSATLLEISEKVTDFKTYLSSELNVNNNAYSTSFSERDFCEEFMQGKGLPYIALEYGDLWLPLQIRSLPGIVIDHWANEKAKVCNEETHKAVSTYLNDRFNSVCTGPLKLMIDDEINHLIISSLVNTKGGIFLFCACDHNSYDTVSQEAKLTYEVLKSAQHFIFLQKETKGFIELRNDKGEHPTVSDIKIVLLLTQGGLANGLISAPPNNIEMMTLSDFISITDSIEELSELQAFWTYLKNSQGIRNPMTSMSDLFASYKDSFGVLNAGAADYAQMIIDPHWGTKWRFNYLKSYWKNAPKTFPNKNKWFIREKSPEKVVIEDKANQALAYSIETEYGTVQASLIADIEIGAENGRMLDLFAQILIDVIQRNKTLVSTCQLLQSKHLLFSIKASPYHLIDAESSRRCDESFDIILEVSKDEGNFALTVNPQKIFSGLDDSKDASFEIELLIETLKKCSAISSGVLPQEIIDGLEISKSALPRFHIQADERKIDVPDYVDPIMPSERDFKLARKAIAVALQQRGFIQGRYELSEAKDKVDAGISYLKTLIEQKISVLDKIRLTKACVEQLDALMAKERQEITRLQLSFNHEVDFDRVKSMQSIQEEHTRTSKNYRYLLEKTLSLNIDGKDYVTEVMLRELLGLIDWYQVLANCSNVLHYGLFVGGITIDDEYIPEVFYTSSMNESDRQFTEAYAKHRLGINSLDSDTVALNHDFLPELESSFFKDTNFQIQTLVNVLTMLSQAHRFGFSNKLSLSYSSTKKDIVNVLCEKTEEINQEEVMSVLDFLTLTGDGILHLARKDEPETEVPYWEHAKRTHRYSIRPLIFQDSKFIWGAGMAKRSLSVWESALFSGYLPADFDMPNTKRTLEKIKQNIEKELEQTSAKIFKRHFSFVEGNVDFHKRFKQEGFEEVGDFDVLVYCSVSNTLIYGECKYNPSVYCLKDAQRLRRYIFGKNENDKKSHISKIKRRRQFIQENRSKIIRLMGWKEPANCKAQDHELYISRDMHYWFFATPYKVPTEFVKVDELNHWIEDNFSQIR